MNSPRRPSDVAPCLEAEQIAALVEGRLAPEVRTRVVNHLADCDECRELVAESIAVAREAGVALPEIVFEGRVLLHPAVRAARVRRVRWAVAASVVLALALAWFVARGRELGLVGSSTVARLATDPAAAARLGGEWSEPVWSVMRGDEPTYPVAATAFRLGVRTADLDLALARGESERIPARRLAAELAILLKSVPLSEPTQSIYAHLVERLAQPVPSALVDTVRFDAREGAESAREIADPALFDLGRWAESGRLAAACGDPEILRVWRRRRPPAVSAASLAPAIAAASTGDGAALEALVRAGAELPGD